MSAPKTPKKQYGRRASGKTQTSLSLSDEVLEKARANAEKEGRSLSNYIEQLLKRTSIIAVIGFLSIHALRPSSRWTMRSLSSTAKAGLAAVLRP